MDNYIRFGDISWHLRTHDSKTCDYFIWRYLKLREYSHIPRIITEQKDTIRKELDTYNQRRDIDSDDGGPWAKVGKMHLGGRTPEINVIFHNIDYIFRMPCNNK